MTIVQMQAARAKDLGGEIELFFPVLDNRFAEEALAPRIHFCRDVFRGLHENIVAMDGKFEIPLIIERHGGDLSERIFAIEHPAVSTGQQRISDVTDAL